jgi:nucleoside triphosphate pyrophosphatase
LGPQREDRVARKRRLVLASASPRRIGLLEAAGQQFDVEASGYLEERSPGEEALGFVERMAREKAREVATRHPGRWVLAADTVVIVDDEPLGKPRDGVEASAMLLRLSGRRHEVATAFVLLDPDGRLFDQRVVRSQVLFRALSPREIEAYVASGEPFDKAGGYAIQGGAGPFVRGVRGSLSNVVGLPMEDVEAALRRAKLWSDSEPRQG